MFSRFYPPLKFGVPKRALKGRTDISVLDIGCGNNSSVHTKHWFPDCRYCGADIQRYNLDDQAVASIDEFYLVGADGSGYEAIPDGAFDLVIMNHVIEHMSDPWPIIAAACSKLKYGGYIWIAFPSVRSLAFPSATHSLNYCDDRTHVRVVDVKDVSNVMLDAGVRVLHGGRSHDPVRFLEGLAAWPWSMAKRALTGAFYGPRLWYLYGFEDHVFGQRRAPATVKLRDGLDQLAMRAVSAQRAEPAPAELTP